MRPAHLMAFLLSACHPKCFVPLCHTVYLAWKMIPSYSLVLKSSLSPHLSQQDLHTTVPLLTATTRLIPDLPDQVSPFFGCFSLDFSSDSCASQKTSGQPLCGALESHAATPLHIAYSLQGMKGLHRLYQWNSESMMNLCCITRCITSWIAWCIARRKIWCITQ